MIMNRKSWKRILALLMIFLMVCMTISGCGVGGVKDFKEGISSGKKDTSAESNDDEIEEADFGGDDVAKGLFDKKSDEKTQDDSLRTLHLARGQAFRNEYNEYTNNLIVRSQEQRLVLTEGDDELFPELNNALNEEYETKKAKTDAWFIDAAQMMREDPSAQDYFGDDTHCYLERNIIVHRADTNVLSLRYAETSYNMGAHGYTGFETVNFDTKTGQRLQLADVVVDVKGFLDLAGQKINERYGEDLFEDAVGYFRNLYSESGEDQLVWTLDANGITVYVNTYAISYYAAGSQVVCIPYDQIQLKDEKYKENPSTYCVDLCANDISRFDFDGDGETEEIEIYGSADYEAPITIVVDGNYENRFETEPCYFYAFQPVLMVMQDSIYLYVVLQVDESSFIKVFEIDDACKVHYIGEANGGPGVAKELAYEEFGYKNMITNPQAFKLASRTDVLGTNTVDSLCHVGSDGSPETFETGKEYEYQRELEPKINIEAERIDTKTGKPSGDTMTIKPGMFVMPYRTDDASWVDVYVYPTTLATSKRVDGPYVFKEFSSWPVEGTSICRLQFEGYPTALTINGIDQMECFDGIMFAG